MRTHTSKSSRSRVFRSTFVTACALAAIASLTLVLPATQARAQENVLGAETPGPPVPKDITVNNTLRDNKLVVKWTNPKVSSATEYRIYRLENYDPEKTLKLVGVVPRDQSPTESFVDNTVLPSRKYTYFLTAKDAFGNQSANSKMAWGKTNFDSPVRVPPAGAAR